MSTPRKESYERRRAKRKRKNVFLKLLFLFVCMYLSISFIVGSFSSSYTSYNVQIGYLEEFITTDGYIFRDQTVISAPKSGMLECEVAEEERVAQGARVASVYQNQIDAAASEQLKKINAEIARLEKYSLQKDVYANDTVRIEQQIAEETKAIPKASYKNQWELISETKEEINRLIDKKRAVTGEKEPDSAVLDHLKAEKQRIESVNHVDRVYLTAPRPGVFTSRIDGMEEYLTVNKLDAITPEYIDELNQKEIRYQDNISEGAPACKIVSNSEWYFAAKVSEEEAKLFSEGESVSLRLFDRTDGVVSAVIQEISDSQGGQAVLSVRSNGYVESIYSTSKANVEIIKQRYSGLKLPAQCVRVKDGKKGVYVLRGEVAKFVPINLLYNNSEWAVVSSVQSESNGLKLYDEAIVKAENLEDGAKLR